MAQEVYGITQHALMESAGRAAFEEIEKHLGTLSGKTVFIFSGKGNNGGDGLVLSRYLDRAGAKVLVFLCFDGEMKAGPAKDNFEAARRADIAIYPAVDFLKRPADAVPDLFVDGIFGTGFRGCLPKIVQDIARKIKPFSRISLALDIPSGLDATDGSASRNCLRVAKTISFGLPKKGFYEGAGPQMCGDVVVKDIGFPRKLLKSYL